MPPWPATCLLARSTVCVPVLGPGPVTVRGQGRHRDLRRPTHPGGRASVPAPPERRDHRRAAIQDPVRRGRRRVLPPATHQEGEVCRLSPRFAQGRHTRAFEDKEPITEGGGANRCLNTLEYAGVEDAGTFADRLAGLVNDTWDLSALKHAWWGVQRGENLPGHGPADRRGHHRGHRPWHLHHTTRRPDQALDLIDY